MKALDITRHRLGISMFDSLLAASAVNNPATTTAESHYDRQLVSFDGTTLKSGGCLPFGRARNNPPLRSTYCPTTVISKRVSTGAKPYVSLAAVGIVECKAAANDKEMILLTRRPSWMRVFPGAWVFPGGAVDAGESMSDAVTREIYEETGVVCSSKVGDVGPLCLWESVYPTNGIPSIRSHHLVVYYCATTNDTALNIQESEVDCAIWLDHDEAKKIVEATMTNNGDSIGNESSKLPGFHGEKILLKDFAGIYPAQHSGAGLAQGSLFALQEFLHLRRN